MTVESAFVLDESYKAAADLSAKQFYCVKLTGAFEVNLANAAADRVWGILQNKPKINESARVRHYGISRAIANGSVTAIAIGDNLGTDANGVLIKKTGGQTGIVAMEATTANGAIISVFITSPTTPQSL